MFVSAKNNDWYIKNGTISSIRIDDVELLQNSYREKKIFEWIQGDHDAKKKLSNKKNKTGKWKEKGNRDVKKKKGIVK